jgi:hypothetical protein
MLNPNSQLANVRVLNFSTIQVKCNHLLEAKTESTKELVEIIRQYADLPFVYIVSPQKTTQVIDLLSTLKAIRSPCYPYALFLVDEAVLNIDDPTIDIVKIAEKEANAILDHIVAYTEKRFHFNACKLQISSAESPPKQVDVVVVGAGITGIYAANRLAEAGISSCILEKRNKIGGIWSEYANDTSQVNSSECAYRLFEKQTRTNRDHSYTREILEDIAQLAQKINHRLYLESGVKQIEKVRNKYHISFERNGETSTIESTGVILAINDRVGRPREIVWKNQAKFTGKIVSGISDSTKDLNWRDKNVVVVGMGAFAIENVRTALEAGARHVTVVCRRHGTVCPKIIDYLNFATPYDQAFMHDKKSNMRNMMYWKKLYDLSGATQPECWMGKIKHDGHTISVSDIWFIGHYLKKIETITGEISDMTANSVVVNGELHLEADIVVNCVGFERNAHLPEALSGYREMYNNNYVDKDFMYLADAYIDRDAFNSLFGSSVLEMVKFYVEVFIRFFNNEAFEQMMAIEGINKLPIEGRKWSHYIAGAMSLIENYPDIKDTAWRQVNKRTDNFLEAHDLRTYISENKREWIDMHRMLSGKAIDEKDCLPYIFDKLAQN